MVLTTQAVGTDSSNQPDALPRRVVYLLGAGATHGSAAFRGSTISLVMPGLIEKLSERMQELFYEKFSHHHGIGRLVNDVVDEDTDFEQLITFLEDAVSVDYREFAAGLKSIFSAVLRSRLDQVRDELGERHSELYAVLVDMHEVPDLGERLEGFLTLNYDSYLEHAIDQLNYSVDFGVDVGGEASEAEQSIRVLKMHGSFGWADQWPIGSRGEEGTGLWIPPGIRKTKVDYPFNAIWGLARELLNCDVLRIVGCNLGPNDWDLVSLLFTTMHTHATGGPYDVEIIAGPETAERIADMFPYLNVKSLLQLPKVGEQAIAELTGGPPKEFMSLSDEERREVAHNAHTKIPNPFEYWLRLKGEIMNRDLASLSTRSGAFAAFVESAG